MQVPSAELQVPPFKQDQNPPLLHPLSYKINKNITYLIIKRKLSPMV